MLIMKKILIITYILAVIFSLHSYLKVEILYNNTYYKLKSIDKRSIRIQQLKTYRFIGKEQMHRIILNTTEKSRLESLLFTGDNYTFNEINLKKIDSYTYKITNTITEISFEFSIGSYDSIIIHTALNFDNKNNTESQFNLLDKLASAVAVKDLLDKMKGDIEPRSDIPRFIEHEKFKLLLIEIDNESDKTFLESMYTLNSTKSHYYLSPYITSIDQNKIRQVLTEADFSFTQHYSENQRKEAYERFVNQLAELSQEDAFKHLVNFVNLNIKITNKSSITSKWTHPIDIYYLKEGDYKSVTLFLHHTLISSGFETKAYFINPLMKRDFDNTNELQNYKGNNKTQLLLKYKYVDTYANINPTVFFPPDHKNSTFITTVKIEDKWLYTTGDRWIDNGIRSSERCCYDYEDGGCYYSELTDIDHLLKNIPLNSNFFFWKVFFPVE